MRKNELAVIAMNVVNYESVYWHQPYVSREVVEMVRLAFYSVDESSPTFAMSQAVNAACANSIRKAMRRNLNDDRLTKRSLREDLDDVTAKTISLDTSQIATFTFYPLGDSVPFIVAQSIKQSLRGIRR